MESDWNNTQCINHTRKKAPQMEGGSLCKKKKMYKTLKKHCGKQRYKKHIKKTKSKKGKYLRR